MNVTRILCILSVTLLAGCAGDGQGSGVSGPFGADDAVGDFDGKCGGGSDPEAGIPELDLTRLDVSLEGNALVIVAKFAGDAQTYFMSDAEGSGLDVIVSFDGNFVNVLVDTDGTSKVADGKADHELAWTGAETLRVVLTNYPDGDLEVVRVGTSSFGGGASVCDVVEATPE